MRKKPRSPKYGNLVARGGVIYYVRMVKGKRTKFSLHTSDWDEAATAARLYEEKKGIGRLPFVEGGVPTFAEFAKRYLDERTDDLARTTRADRGRELEEGGPILRHLGPRRLDEIDAASLEAWWTTEVVYARRSTKTAETTSTPCPRCSATRSGSRRSPRTRSMCFALVCTKTNRRHRRAEPRGTPVRRSGRSRIPRRSSAYLRPSRPTRPRVGAGVRS